TRDDRDDARLEPSSTSRRLSGVGEKLRAGIAALTKQPRRPSPATQRFEYRDGAHARKRSSAFAPTLVDSTALRAEPFAPAVRVFFLLFTVPRLAPRPAFFVPFVFFLAIQISLLRAASPTHAVPARAQTTLDPDAAGDSRNPSAGDVSLVANFLNAARYRRSCTYA